MQALDSIGPLPRANAHCGGTESPGYHRVGVAGVKTQLDGRKCQQLEFVRASHQGLRRSLHQAQF